MRRAGVGVLVGLAVLLTAGVIGFLFLPVKSCPWCVGSELSASSADPPLDCPVCFDRGKLSLARFRAAPKLDARVANLIWTLGRSSHPDILPVVEALIQRSGRDAKTLLGEEPFARRAVLMGRVKFVRAEGKESLLLQLYPRGLRTGENEFQILLFIGVDGTLLDCLRVVPASPAMLQASIPANPSDGEIAWISAESLTPSAPAVRWMGLDGRIAGESEPKPITVSPKEHRFRVTVRGGRLAFLPPTSATRRAAP